MKEKQAKYWSRARVMAYLMGSLIRPARLKGVVTELFRATKQSAASIPCQSLVDVFPNIDRGEVKVRYWPRQGGGSIADVVALAQVAKYLDCRRLFEIGTFRGYTTYHLALNVAADAIIYTLDLPASHIHSAKLELTDVALINKPLSGEWFLDTPVAAKISQLLGDSATFDYSSYEGQMDLVYVDGAHSYEYVASDSLTARRLTTPNGIILWHDYPTWPGVWACLEDLSRQWSGRFTWIEGTALVVWQP